MCIFIGDKIFGYNAGSQKAIVALSIITNELHEDSNGLSFINKCMLAIGVDAELYAYY